MQTYDLIGNKDRSNVHAFTAGEKPSRSSRLCYGDGITAGKTVFATVEDYTGVADATVETVGVEVCEHCRKIAESIAATAQAFEVRTLVERLLQTAQGSGSETVTLHVEDVATILSALAPWEAKGRNVRPDGKALFAEVVEDSKPDWQAPIYEARTGRTFPRVTVSA
jgi:hypothetical protein